MNKIPLSLFFFIALIFAVLAASFFPTWRCSPFAPLIPLVLARYSLAKSLWAALFIGLCMDLITSSAPFGLYSLCFTLTSAFLYKHRRHFFIDKAIGLPSFTFFGSLLSPVHAARRTCVSGAACEPGDASCAYLRPIELQKTCPCLLPT